MTIKTLRLGTRGSPLALTQANMVKDEIAKISPDTDVIIVPIRTTGDWRPADGETRLSIAAGGKGQFAREIESALLDGRIDAAVHSAKDMETNLPDGLILGAYLPREDARDAIIINDLAKNSQNEFGLARNITVGTASLRRQAFLLHKRPDLSITPLRGNVHTRLEKLASGQVDATLLAMAGLKRLGLEHHISAALPINDFLPAAGQGAVCIELPAEDNEILSIISQITHLETKLCVECERAVIDALNGSCHTPIGAHATLSGNMMHIRTAIASLDGKQYFEEEERGEVQTPGDAVAFGERIGRRLKSRIPPELLTQQAGP